jgi:hypothetical protein
MRLLSRGEVDPEIVPSPLLDGLRPEVLISDREILGE